MRVWGGKCQVCEGFKPWSSCHGFNDSGRFRLWMLQARRHLNSAKLVKLLCGEGEVPVQVSFSVRCNTLGYIDMVATVTVAGLESSLMTNRLG